MPFWMGQVCPKMIKAGFSVSFHSLHALVVYFSARECKMHVHLVWSSPLLSLLTSHIVVMVKKSILNENQYSILEEKSHCLSLCGSSLSSLSVVVAWAPPSLSYLCDKKVRSLFYSLLRLSFPFCIQSPSEHRTVSTQINLDAIARASCDKRIYVPFQQSLSS